MLIDFSSLPPELNSARMYTGPGPNSLQTAATTWQGLSDDLLSTAESYASVISELASMQWMGKSSASMISAIVPYLTWLTRTAAQAKRTASQATAAVAAFEQALAMTVPPAAVTANRSQLLKLIATNFFGQNTGLIATAEAQYAEMWAQDAAAMVNYSATSTAAATLTPFAAPNQTTDSAGLTAQSAAVSKAASGATTAADDSPVGIIASTLGSLLEFVAGVILPVAPELSPILFALGEGIQFVGGALPSLVKKDFTILDGILAIYTSIGSVNNVFSIATGTLGAEKNLGILPNLGATVADAAASAPKAAPVAPELLAPLNSIANALSGGASLRGAASGLGGGVTAGMTSAGRIGQMSVPSSWAAPVAPTIVRPVGDATPLTTVQVGDGEGSGMPGVPGVPLGGGSGRMGAPPRYGAKLTVMTRPYAGG